MNSLRIASLFVMVAVVPSAVAADPLDRVADEIRQEAVRPNRGDAGRPLPLAAHWNSSGAEPDRLHAGVSAATAQEGTSHPALARMAADRRVDSTSTSRQDDPRRQKYIDDRMKEYEPVIKELARLRLAASRFWRRNGRAS